MSCGSLTPIGKGFFLITNIMKEIELSKTGKKNKGLYKAIIDDEYFDIVSKYNWIALVTNGRVSAYTHIGTGKNKRYSIYLHTLIMNTPKGFVVDHINHNALDNRKENLRICTHQENMRNTTSRKNSSSKYLGVYLDKTRNKWTARVVINGLLTNLGRFINEEDAAKAYNIGALKNYKEFANLNKI